MAERSPRDRILRFLANNAQRAFRPKELAKKLGYTDNREYRRFRSDLEELIERRLIDSPRGGMVQHKRVTATPVGRITITSRGFGFVSVEGLADDIYVSSSNTGTALDGDLVRVELFARNRRAAKPGRGPDGEVVEILERGRSRAVGTFRVHGRLGYVVPDDQRLTRDIYVEDPGGAQPGDKVVVTIDRFEDRRGAPEGRIERIIGPESDAGVRIAALAMSLGVDVDYPAKAESEARANAARRRTVEPGRVDLRGLPTVTIDPVDAKDFDDAISIEEMESGMIRVHVHVADVAHYVDVDSALDQEAFARGTSTYLVDRVVPMLPEVLSADACSLRPREDRFAMTCTVELNAAGDKRDVKIRNSLIRSDHRLTYEEAQQVIDGADHECGDMIRRANEVARTLRRARVDAGSIEFDLPEVRVELDEAGTVVSIRPKERLEAHRLIEELMLLANRAVAEQMRDADGFVFRVHASPDADRLAQVARYVNLFGFELEVADGYAPPEAINSLIASIRGTPQEPVIQNALLRAMAKAEYAVNNIGHYGLAVRDYTHFTSPIRRYPDLMVHRLLKARISGGAGAGPEGGTDGPRPAPAPAGEAARHCSERERVATDAERASVKLKQVEYAANHLGDPFDGVISGVSQFGVFVQLSELLVEGLVHVRDMGDDYYEYDEATYRLVGTKTGRVFQVGRPVTVVIVRADTESREIDLLFADSDESAPRKRLA